MYRGLNESIYGDGSTLRSGGWPATEREVSSKLYRQMGGLGNGEGDQLLMSLRVVRWVRAGLTCKLQKISRARGCGDFGPPGVTKTWEQ
jgi:hypothetical protein